MERLLAAVVARGNGVTLRTQPQENPEDELVLLLGREENQVRTPESGTGSTDRLVSSFLGNLNSKFHECLLVYQIGHLGIVTNRIKTGGGGGRGGNQISKIVPE